MTTTLPTLVVRPSEQELTEICPKCGQPRAQAIQVHAGTIADIYDVWPMLRGNRAGPKVLVIELKENQ